MRCEVEKGFGSQEKSVDGTGSRFSFRRLLSSAGRPGEILPQLFLYPSSRRV
jgi:hypothetical protein